MGLSLIYTYFVSSFVHNILYLNKSYKIFLTNNSNSQENSVKESRNRSIFL